MSHLWNSETIENQNKTIVDSIHWSNSCKNINLCKRPSLWLCKCKLEDPVVPCLAYSSSLGSARLLIPEFAPMEAPSPFIMWPVWGDCQCTTARSLGMGLFVQNENTAQLNKLTHAVSHVHLLHCNPSYFPFSQYSQGEQCVGCRPQQPCRLSV